MNRIISLLTQDGFWIINKNLAQSIGRDETFLLTDLITKYNYFLSKEQILIINNEYYFYATSESIEKDTMFSYYEQKKLLSKLVKLGYIKIIKKGVPAKLYFNIVENKILSFFNTEIEITSKLELEKVKNYYISNKEKNKRNNKEDNNILVQFDKFWDLYDKKVSKEKTLSKFKKLNDTEIEKLFEVLPQYIESTPDKQYRKNPDTYLHNKCFNDEIIFRIPNERNKNNTGNNTKSDFRDNFVETLENSYKINPDLWIKNSGDTESDTVF